jgi:hypothetical protein
VLQRPEEEGGGGSERIHEEYMYNKYQRIPQGDQIQFSVNFSPPLTGKVTLDIPLFESKLSWEFIFSQGDPLKTSFFVCCIRPKPNIQKVGIINHPW